MALQLSANRGTLRERRKENQNLTGHSLTTYSQGHEPRLHTYQRRSGRDDIKVGSKTPHCRLSPKPLVAQAHTRHLLGKTSD